MWIEDSLLSFMIKENISCKCNSIASYKDNYMQGLGSTFHFTVFKMCEFQSVGQLIKKINENM